MRRPLIRKRLGHLAHAPFCSRVSRHGDAALKRQQGRGKDHLARTASDHSLSQFARQHELRTQIHFDDLVPVFVGMFGRWFAQDCTSIVYQDIYRRALGLHVGEELVDRFAIGKIAGKTPELAA